MKLGQKVKLISNKCESCNSIGDTGIVTEVDFTDDTCRVKVKGKFQYHGNWSNFTDLEIVEGEEITYTKEELKELFSNFLETL